MKMYQCNQSIQVINYFIYKSILQVTGVTAFVITRHKLPIGYKIQIRLGFFFNKKLYFEFEY